MVVLQIGNQRQTILTLSTVEPEYVALSKARQECIYIPGSMSSAGGEQAQATTVHEENSGDLSLTRDFIDWGLIFFMIYSGIGSRDN